MNNIQMITYEPFGEIIQSSLNTWTAQSYKWDSFPNFGSLIAIDSADKTIFGVVHHIQTGSLDTNRNVVPFGKTEKQLRLEQPQIFEFLQTNLYALTIGYKQNGHIYYQLAPIPPKIHDMARIATIEERKDFFSNEHYLHLLFAFSSQLFSLDELLLAHLKDLSDTNMLSSNLLSKFIETFSLLTANDYRRLKLFLQRAQSVIVL